MRVLLSCYYFSPYRGGEAAVGWKYATGLAKLGHDVTVLYGDLSQEEPMKADVEKYKEKTGFPENLTAIHVKPSSLSRYIHNLHAKPGLFFLYYPAYRMWQKSALSVAKRLHSANAFNLVHHITIIGYREPGFLWDLGVPFFWGPINGAASMPWGFIPGFGCKGKYQHTLRNVLNQLQIRLPSRSKKAASRASKIWVVTEEDRIMVEDIWGFQADTMIETGAQPSENATLRKRDAGDSLHLIWCGILEARKSLHLVLRAMANLPSDIDCKLHVIGEGAERHSWQKLANDLALGNRVHWHGRVSHAEAQALMSAGHALIHSSVKEGTPHVVLEAMALGMPVICHDACGMGAAVDDDSGIKVEMRNPETSVAGFRNAILLLWSKPELLTKLSAGALQRALKLSWENKVRQVAEAYCQILSQKP